jgi:diguanylate cyclase (GGDEF)-like protein
LILHYLDRAAVSGRSAKTDQGIIERYNQASYEAKRQIGLSRFFRLMRICYIIFSLVLLLPVLPYLQYPVVPLALITAALAYALCRYYMPMQTFRHRVVIVLLECTDLLFIAGFIYFTGGIRSPFHAAIALPILACTVRFGLKSGIYNLFLSALLVVGAVVFAPLPANYMPSYFHVFSGLGTLFFGIWAVNFLVKEDLKLREELYSASVTDHLTGLYHSGYMRERVNEAIRHHQREGRNFSIVFLDLDNFKKINDHYGHLTGDAALKHVAGLLRSLTRKGETLSRYGGDEFLLFLPATNAQQAAETLQRLCREVEARPYPVENGAPIKFAISGGAAEYPSDGKNLEQLLQTADRRMYSQKNDSSLTT